MDGTRRPRLSFSGVVNVPGGEKPIPPPDRPDGGDEPNIDQLHDSPHIVLHVCSVTLSFRCSEETPLTAAISESLESSCFSQSIQLCFLCATLEGRVPALPSRNRTILGGTP
jgi:hypothetical protein